MSSTSQLPGPPSAAIIDLAIAELCIYIVLFGPAVWIAWKHGKNGMTCWSIFLSFLCMRFASDIYQIIHRNDPGVTNACLIVTEAGTIACLSMTLIGLVYEANLILPLSKKESWIQKIPLAVTHLTSTTGIALATYGGSPSETGGVFSSTMDKAGNVLMIILMLMVCVWIWPSWQRTKAFSGHSNFRNARWLLLAACAGMPFQMIRLIYNTTYAFDPITSLDPVMGSFATQFVLMFLMHLGVAITATAGGWVSRHVRDNKDITYDGLNLESSVEATK